MLEPWKFIVLSAGAVTFLLGYLAMAVVLAYRHWAPFRAKQPLILLLSLISSTFWWIGNLQALEIIQQEGVFSSCLWWGIWAQFIFGVGLYVMTILFRMLRLYFILVLVAPPKGLFFWSIIGGLYLPNILLGIIPMFFPGQFFSESPEQISSRVSNDLACNFFDPIYDISLVTLLGTYLAVLSFLNYKISRVRDAFNEYSETKFGLLCAGLVLTINFGMVVSQYQDEIWGKIIICVTQLFAANVMFWSLLLKPLIGFLFYPEGYLDAWKAGLRQEVLPIELKYGVEPESTIPGAFPQYDQGWYQEQHYI